MWREVFLHSCVCASSIVSKKTGSFSKKKVQLFNIWTFYMKTRLHIIFWTANATDFIGPILESSYKVLPRKVKLKPPTTRLVFGGVEFFDCFYFQSVITSLWWYKYGNVFYYPISTCDVSIFCMFTQVHAPSF